MVFAAFLLFVPHQRAEVLGLAIGLHKVPRMTNRRTQAPKMALLELSTIMIIVVVGVKPNGVDANIGKALKADKVVLRLMTAGLSRRSRRGVNRPPRP
jgi:hypothetical protein